MITRKDTSQIKILYDIQQHFSNKRICFFDIETTGFSRLKNTIYLISVVYYDNHSLKSIQWFDDDGHSEQEIISEFITFIKDFDVVINYNGNSFDIPFIEAKAEFYELQFSFDNFISYDIYKEVFSYRFFFGLDNLKQKSLELFLKIQRDDEYDGGRLIQIYYDYLKRPTKDYLELLLLHNYDDIYGLVKICDILSYVSIIKGDYTITDYECNENLIINCHLNNRLKVPFSIRKDNIYISAGNDILKILIPLEEKCLKYFYTNYKDYYYLPDEDMAIHKSVAQFVDKGHRTKAKKDNCYTKKTGVFAREFSEIFKPAFKEESNSKEFYFEINDFYNIINNNNNIGNTTNVNINNNSDNTTNVNANDNSNSNFDNNPNNLSELYTYVNDIIKNISRKHWEDYPLTGSPLNINSDRLD